MPVPTVASNCRRAASVGSAAKSPSMASRPCDGGVVMSKYRLSRVLKLATGSRRWFSHTLTPSERSTSPKENFFRNQFSCKCRLKRPGLGNSLDQLGGKWLLHIWIYHIHRNSMFTQNLDRNSTKKTWHIYQLDRRRWKNIWIGAHQTIHK